MYAFVIVIKSVMSILTDPLDSTVNSIVQSIGAKNMSIVHFVIKAPKLVETIVSMCRVQG